MTKKAYFISDLHLGAKHGPASLPREKKVVSWLDSIKDSACELYLLGDILDYWYEYKYVVPKGFVRFFGKLAELSDAGVKIYWFIGNHDIWMFDYFQKEMGIEVIDGILEKEILGKRFCLSHGDGVGQLSGGFKFLRALFRNKLCQCLYASVHPRWTIPFATNCSASSRKSQLFDNKPSKKTEEKAGDIFQKLIDYSSSFDNGKIDYFVFGHLHIVENRPLPNGSNIIILGDWINHFSYGEFDGNTFLMRYYTN